MSCVKYGNEQGWNYKGKLEWWQPFERGISSKY